MGMDNNNNQRLALAQADSNGSHIRMNNSRSGGGYFVMGVGDSASNASIVPAGGLFFYNGTTRMVINSSGNVGIGTTSPTAKLDINGTVRYRGNTYNQLTYQVSGNYSANTWYTIATNATLTEQGIYILVAYVEDFTAGGSNYYIHAASTNFYWDTTSTCRRL